MCCSIITQVYVPITYLDKAWRAKFELSYTIFYWYNMFMCIQIQLFNAVKKGFENFSNYNREDTKLIHNFIF